jgi:ferredoxin
MIFGGWIGLVIGVKLISLALRRQRTDYEPDRGACVACARCFEYCPNELVRRGLMPASELPLPGAPPVVVPAAVRAAMGVDK